MGVRRRSRQQLVSAAEVPRSVDGRTRAATERRSPPEVRSTAEAELRRSLLAPDRRRGSPRLRGCRRGGRRDVRARGAWIWRHTGRRPLHGSQSRMPRKRVAPILNSWPTRPLRSMPRVTRLRRCSSGPSGGSNDSHTSASTSVSALPGTPEGNVPAPATCRSPASPRPASARTTSTCCTRSPAAGAIQIPTIVPVAVGATVGGGSASATSAAASRKPASIQSFRMLPSPPGSQTTPEGTPYMTT